MRASIADVVADGGAGSAISVLADDACDDDFRARAAPAPQRPFTMRPTRQRAEGTAQSQDGKMESASIDLQSVWLVQCSG